MPASPSLPAPRRSRWQPLRSGVLNLYRYDQEEFHFEEGRLLLRGNNGSGKSRVLALQLPFLLDGEVSPARVEPDGDAAKRIEWNLLMGRHPDRTGYTWIEFGRRADDGTEHFLTLGCGLRAVAGHTGLHSRWFFTTTQRIGLDLFLQNSQRMPLGPEPLAAALGSAGRIHKKSEDYRRAVDEALFGLGARYGALVELLLRLRRPQLTRKLDENELPDALSDALPTLSAAIVDEVAESFRSLQADKDTVRDFNSARDAVAAFLREYTLYVRIAVRRRAAAVRTTHSGYENAQRSVKDATARLEAASAELASLATHNAELQTSLAGAESVERTLAESPEMRTAEQIRLAGDTARESEKALARTQSDEAAALAFAQQTQARQARVEEDSADFDQKCSASIQTATASASAAGLATEHHEHLSPNLAPSAHTVAETALNRVLAQRNQGIKLLVSREKAVADSALLLATAEHALREAEAAASSARDDEHTAREALAEQGAALLTHYSAWQSAARHLRPEEPSTLTDAFDAWLEQREGPGPLRRAAEDAQQRAITGFAAREHALVRTTDELDRTLADLAAEIARLENGDTPPPPPPPTRRAERHDRPGAPLWRVCDFHPHVAPAARAGVEAALQGSGLLDAWLLPDGRLVDPATEDTFLQPSNEPTTHNVHLGEVLIPAIDPADTAASQLSPDTVARALAAIGYKSSASQPSPSSHVWISADGAWQLGPLSGFWTKPEADYIGESTRAAARRRQLELLRARRIAEQTALAQTRAALAALAQARTEANAEFAAAPSEEPLLRAGFALESAARAVATTMLAAEKATRLADTRRADCEQHRATLHTDADDLRLASWLGRLDALAEASQRYAHALAALWPTLRHGETITGQLATLREQTAAAEAEFATRRARREESATTAESARRRFETLQETHGQTVSAILEKHTAAKAAVATIKTGLAANASLQLTRTAEQSAAQAQLASAEEKRGTQDLLRREAIASLRQLAAQRLLPDADPSLRDHDADEDWSVARAVDIARDIDSRLGDTLADPAGWQQRQDQIHGHVQELRDRLITHGHQPETHSTEDVIHVRCLFQARALTMTELLAAFSAEIEARERLLQAREREIIENHLLAEAAVELQKLIRAAEAWRASANEELHSRPTSTGVRFRFQWEADTEIRFHEIRPILLRKGELWTPVERTAVATFLQGRIADAQSNDESGSWRDHLARALDYRRWHRFVIERQQEGQWRRLNKTTYGTGSGGEKALALTLPRFAAAAAHYRGAAPTAPRLVMLDEAFAGIDPTMRAQCLGVLTQFDLDVVMTSELEWGCYATVPALAIYHLTTLPGLDAVAATRWIWNGREKRQIDHPEPQTIPPSPTSEPPSDDLFINAPDV